MSTARTRQNVCATPTEPAILKSNVSTKTWRANGNSWPITLKNSKGLTHFERLPMNRQWTSSSQCPLPRSLAIPSTEFFA